MNSRISPNDSLGTQDSMILAKNTRLPDLSSAKAIPLCVDLDGTLCRSDLLYEGLLTIIRTKPTLLLKLIPALIKGKTFIKEFIARNAQLNLAELPWREEVIDKIKSAKKEGCCIVLATASHEIIAQSVADHLGLFDEVIATSRETNLKGPKKAEELSKRFNHKGFDYIGDCAADIPVWKAAHRSFAVNNSFIFDNKVKHLPTELNITVLDSAGGPDSSAGGSGLAGSSGNISDNDTNKDDQPLTTYQTPNTSKLYVLTKALRVHQWSKNLLLFVPLIFAHKLNNFNLLFSALIGALSFSLCASAVYLINDLLDLPSDRRHPTKRFRPLARGTLGITDALKLAVLLISSATILAQTISSKVILVLTLYFIVTLLYSTVLKRLLVIDILTLALLYTTRIFAGCVATNLNSSPWLLAFSVFFFLSLGAVKRFVELQSLNERGETKATGRGYLASDASAMQSIGLASGVTAVMVLALYVTSPVVTQFYHTPDLLLLSGPLALYWILRVWFLAARGELVEDPVLFALTDLQSYVVASLGLLILLAATF